MATMKIGKDVSFRSLRPEGLRGYVEENPPKNCLAIRLIACRDAENAPWLITIDNLREGVLDSVVLNILNFFGTNTMARRSLGSYISLGGDPQGIKEALQYLLHEAFTPEQQQAQSDQLSFKAQKAAN